MRYDKKIMMSMFIIITLVITGCGTREGPSEQFNPYKGTEGLVFSFVKDSPPKEVPEGEPFSALLDLKNKGATNIINGMISIGIEEEYMETEEDLINIELDGKSLRNYEGEQELKIIRMTAKNIDPQSEVHTSLITATACYPYETILQEEVCIDTDPYNMRRTPKACAAKDISLSSQGAPIAVTRIETEMMLTEDDMVTPKFKLHITNKGKGKAVNYLKTMNLCTSQPITSEDWNVIKVKEAKIGINELICKPQKPGFEKGYIKLQEGKDTIICTAEREIDASKSSYTTPIIIELEYGYSETISKQVMIKREIIY